MLEFLKRNKLIFILIHVYIVSIIYVSPYNLINDLTFPVNDEWYYALPIINFLDFNKIIVADGMAAWSIPQIIIGYFSSKFFGFSFINLRLIVIFFSILNIFLIYFYLIKFFNFKKVNTIILLSCFVFYPSIYLSNITFMSETIFFTFFLFTLISIENYKIREDFLSLFFLNLFIFLLFLQRQIGILFIIYLFYIFFLQKGNLLFRKKQILYTCIFQFSLFCLISLLISYYIGNTNPYSLGSLSIKNILFSIYNIPQFFLYVGFISIPYFFFIRIDSFNFKNNRNYYFFFTILLIISVLTLYFKFGKLMPYFNNVFSIYGTFRLNELLPGERNLFFGKEFYYLLTLICLISFLRMLIVISNNNFKSYFHLLSSPLYFMSIIFFLFSLLMFKNLNDRYIYILLFCFLVFFNSLFNYSITKKDNNIRLIFCTIVISSFIFISVVTARDMFRWSEASWTLAKKTTEKYNINIFNIMAGHTWNWEKYRYLSQDLSRSGFVEYSNIKEMNDYNYYVKFGKYEDSIDTISFKRMNITLFISLNKSK